MRVVFVASWLGRGGAERQIVELGKGLRDAGHDARVVVLYGGGALEPELRANAVPLIEINRRSRYDLTGLIRLIRTLRSMQPDIVYSFLAIPNILTAVLKPMLRPARIVWGVRASEVHWAEFDMITRAAFALTRTLSRVPDLIIVNSNAGLEYHAARNYPRNKMVVVANGINQEVFRPHGERRQSKRREWNISDDVPLVGLVGRIDPMKDHETFLRAAALVTEKRPDTRFACVGSTASPRWHELKALTRELDLADHVTWTGEIPDMAAAYNALDVLCSSSSAEGFSNVIAEAMACGVPTVVTDVGDSALIVGKAGTVVPRRDPRALADGLVRTLEQIPEGRSELAAAARAQIVDNYNVSRLVAKTAELFAALCGSKS